MSKRRLSHSLLGARRKFFLKHGYRCHYCGSELWDLNRRLHEPKGFAAFMARVIKALRYEPEYIPARYLATVDHIVPLSRGGSDGEDNQIPACKSCNSSKGAKH